MLAWYLFCPSVCHFLSLGFLAGRIFPELSRAWPVPPHFKEQTFQCVILRSTKQNWGNSSVVGRAKHWCVLFLGCLGKNYVFLFLPALLAPRFSSSLLGRGCSNPQIGKVRFLRPAKKLFLNSAHGYIYIHPKSRV